MEARQTCLELLRLPAQAQVFEETGSLSFADQADKLTGGWRPTSTEEFSAELDKQATLRMETVVAGTQLGEARLWKRRGGQVRQLGQTRRQSAGEGRGFGDPHQARAGLMEPLDLEAQLSANGLLNGC